MQQHMQFLPSKQVSLYIHVLYQPKLAECFNTTAGNKKPLKYLYLDTELTLPSVHN